MSKRLNELVQLGIWLSIFCLTACFFTDSLSAEDLLPPDRPIQEVFDHYVEQELKSQNLTPVEQADDLSYLRRVTLDLVGRIPTADEAHSFASDTSPDKREALVDRLIASPGFNRHLATELDIMLMQTAQGSIKNYLQDSLESGKSWKQIFEEVILAEEKVIADDLPDEEKKKLQTLNESTQFLKRRVKDIDLLANDVSVLFFGVNVSCAKCHDHPLVDDWKQDHFYGMKSFFNRTFDNGNFLGEHEYGLVTFKTTAGENRDAKLMFLTGEVLTEPEHKEPTDAEKKKEKELLEKAKKDKVPPPAPSYSRRVKLIEVIAQPGQHNFFARSIVNRIVHRLMGEGLVTPVDQMHSGNAVTHPELLEWLARDMETNDYQFKRLIRGVVLSKAYGRSSVWEGESRPYSGFYAVANVKPLMPQQLAVSLRLAAQDPEQYSGETPPDDLEQRLEGLDRSSQGLANLFDVPGSDFEVSVTEALLFSNNQRVMNEMVADGGGKLVTKMKDLSTAKEMIELASWNIFSRPPKAEEYQILENYFNERAEQPLQACQQIVWAMMTSSEFRFNH